MSFCIQEDSQRPKHFVNGIRAGTSVLAKLEKVVTVRRFSGSAVIIELSSNTLQKFVDPFKILRKKVSTVSHKFSVMSSFRVNHVNKEDENTSDITLQKSYSKINRHATLS